MSREIGEIVSEVCKDRLKGYVRALEGLRHGTENYAILEEKARIIEAELSSFGLAAESQPVFYKQRNYRNIIATLQGSRSGKEMLLVGAHYDSPRESPGADDNASGVAVLLEAARILSGSEFTKTIQFVAFTLEEPQTWNHSILRGSRQFVLEARKSGVIYEAVLILECVGYTDGREFSQIVPPLIGVPVSKVGDFLAVVANKRSRRLMETFCRCSSNQVPGLKLLSHAFPFQGYLLPQCRFSDHASFWNGGYPALMLTDTAMFRNPHYHTHHDTHDTLNFDFMADVARSVAAFVTTAGGLLQRAEFRGQYI
jgi:Zn-dependent M28 family amino/carboxypeptidase